MTTQILKVLIIDFVSRSVQLISIVFYLKGSHISAKCKTYTFLLCRIPSLRYHDIDVSISIVKYKYKAFIVCH